METDLSPFRTEQVVYCFAIERNWRDLYGVRNKVGKCCFNDYRSTGRCSVAKFVSSLRGVTRGVKGAGASTSRRFESERLSGTQFVVFLTRCWFLADSSLVPTSRHTALLLKLTSSSWTLSGKN